MSFLLVFSSCGNPRETSNHETQEGTLSSDRQTTKAVEKNYVDFCVFGDNLIHEKILRFANQNSGGDGSVESFNKGFDFKPLYSFVKSVVEEADFSICNQSSLVYASSDLSTLSGYPKFHSPKELADDLIEIGFDGINIGNNHLLDMGENGMYHSVRFWNEKDVFLFGGYESVEEKQKVESKVIRIENIKVAVLSYTATTNGLSAGKNTPIPYFTLNRTAILKKMLSDEVSACKSISDAVIVLMNWGNQEGYEPGEIQKETAKILCEAGADVIIGTGPKVIQPIQWIESEKQNHKTLCAYSLGNFMCTMDYMENLLGGYLKFRVDKEKICYISQISFHPIIVFYNENYSDIRVLPLEEYTEDLHILHGSNLKFGFGDLSWFEKTVRKYISKEFYTP